MTEASVQLHDTDTMRGAMAQVAVLAAAGLLVSILLAYTAGTRSGPFDGSAAADVVNEVLRAASAASHWVIPMYLSALIAGLAVMLLPDWRERQEHGAFLPRDVAEVRRTIGSAARVIAAGFFVWAAWVAIAFIVPGLTSGPDGVGVILAAPPVLILALFASRAALGTVQQRLRDACWALSQSRRALARVRRLTIYAGGRPAQWPVWVVVGVTGVAIGTPIGLAVAGHAPLLRTIGAAVGGLICVGAAVALWAVRYRSTSRLERGWLGGVCGLLTVMGVGFVVSGSSSWVSATAGVLAAMPVLVVVAKWRGKQLLAGTATPALQRKASAATERFLMIGSAVKHAGWTANSAHARPESTPSV